MRNLTLKASRYGFQRDAVDPGWQVGFSAEFELHFVFSVGPEVPVPKEGYRINTKTCPT